MGLPGTLSKEAVMEWSTWILAIMFLVVLLDKMD
jgi:preprotein translocase subunit SecG